MGKAISKAPARPGSDPISRRVRKVIAAGRLDRVELSYGGTGQWVARGFMLANDVGAAAKISVAWGTAPKGVEVTGATLAEWERWRETMLATPVMYGVGGDPLAAVEAMAPTPLALEMAARQAAKREG